MSDEFENAKARVEDACGDWLRTIHQMGFRDACLKWDACLGCKILCLRDSRGLETDTGPFRGEARGDSQGWKLT